SPRTVEIYRANMMEKLKARSVSEAVRVAILAGVPARGEN
ncbi:LuxR C-terminal-related transcriptional regulator, partial [Stella sp.]